MTPKQKAADVLSTTTTPNAPHWAVLAGLRGHALNVSGDPDRDLDAIVMHTDPTRPESAVFIGTWKGLVRLLAMLEIRGDEGDITLLGTKGKTEVDLANPQFGLSGPEIGNSILIAAAHHAAIFYLRASGIRVVTNTPYTPRLKAKYELMGFDNGERLAVDDPVRLEKAFAYVEGVYQAFGLDLSRPPLPL